MAANKQLLRSGREKGTVVIEMAILVPVLLLMVAGVVDLGMLLWEREVLTNAAREGARAAARGIIDTTVANGVKAEMTETQVRSLVQTYLTNYNIKNASGNPITLTTANCIYTRDTSTNPPTLSVRLQNIPAKMMMLPNIQGLFPGTPVGGTINLDANSTMASEW